VRRSSARRAVPGQRTPRDVAKPRAIWPPEPPKASPRRLAYFLIDSCLDAAVLATYGFTADSDILARLLALNLTVAARIDAKQEVSAPGIPRDYPTRAALVTADCITP
jgi:hypothetical protein